MSETFDLNLPETIKDKFASGTPLDYEESQAVEDLVKQLDVGDSSVSKATSPMSSTGAPAAGFALTPGTVAVKQRMARVRTHFDTRVKWQGLKSKVQTRAVYKVLNVTANVPQAEAQKWGAMLACVAGSSWLTVFLWGLAFGPVGWVVFAAAVVANTMVCFSQIAPEDFKAFTGGDVSVDEERDSWG